MPNHLEPRDPGRREKQEASFSLSPPQSISQRERHIIRPYFGSVSVRSCRCDTFPFAGGGRREKEPHCFSLFGLGFEKTPGTQSLTAHISRTRPPAPVKLRRCAGEIMSARQCLKPRAPGRFFLRRPLFCTSYPHCREHLRIKPMLTAYNASPGWSPD